MGISKQSYAQSAAYKQMLDTLLKHTVKEISPKEAAAKKKAIFLDARKVEEYNVSHIAKAIRVGYSDFTLSRLPALNNRTPIIVYCSVGYRSEKITEKLLAAGYKDVQNLYGGIFEWVNEGYPLQDSVGRTLNVHAFNKDWGKWLQAGNKKYN